MWKEPKVHKPFDWDKVPPVPRLPLLEQALKKSGVHFFSRGEPIHIKWTFELGIARMEQKVFSEWMTHTSP